MNTLRAVPATFAGRTPKEMPDGSPNEKPDNAPPELPAFDEPENPVRPLPEYDPDLPPEDPINKFSLILWLRQNLF
ncbi:hypothetical protein [Roseicyclus marinus]|uniref:Uncharacterized protein n=1 Tax=Roseicyclus marinus TaxID=2161673 RepID=A0AA48KNV4_9RHOB|nr:hypothetical protein MACH21_27130 [Roseicyclus marinus]